MFRNGDSVVISVTSHARLFSVSRFTKYANTDKKKEQNFTGILTAEAVKVCKLVKQQDDRPEVQCDGEVLKNVFRFKYLGTIFTADVNQKYDIKVGIAKAYVR